MCDHLVALLVCSCAWPWRGCGSWVPQEIVNAFAERAQPIYCFAAVSAVVVAVGALASDWHKCISIKRVVSNVQSRRKVRAGVFRPTGNVPPRLVCVAETPTLVFALRSS